MTFVKGHKNEWRTKESYVRAGKNISKAHKKSGLKQPSRLNIKHTQTTKDKISKNNVRYWLGKNFVCKEETKEKMRNLMKGKNCGIKNGMWQDGISFEPYGLEFNNELKEQIRKRDNYICQKCKMLEIESLKKWNKKLSIHHIDYDKKNNDKGNLITLCQKCNTGVNGNREYWTQYFQKELCLQL